MKGTASAKRPRVAPIAVLVAALLAGTGTALGQIPGLPGASPPKAEAPARAPAEQSTQERRAQLQKLFDEARAQAERPPEAQPPGIDPREASEWRDALLRLTTAYDIELRGLDQIERARAGRQAAEAKERDWHGFDSPPPYSILTVDDLRDAAAAIRDRVTVLEGEIAQVRADAQRAQDELRRAEEAVRRSEEALASARTPEDKAREAWRRDLARLKARAAAAAVAAATVHAQFRGDDLAARRAEAALLARQIAVAAAGATFTEGDLAKARQRIDEKLGEVRRELAAIADRRNGRLRERDAARQAVESMRANPKTGPGELAAGEARLAAAEAWIEADRDRGDALRGQRLVGEETAVLWGARYAAATSPDAEERRAAALKLREAAQRAGRFKDYVESVARETRSRLAEVEARLSRPDLAPEALRYEQEALAARRTAALAAERLLDTTGDTTAQLGRWVADLDRTATQRDLRTRLVDSWTVLRDTLREIWNFELFEVEDTTVAEGKSVTISRGVTVGKSVGAVLVFLLGYWAIAALARRIEKGVVSRGVDPARVRTLRRWVLTFSALLLAVVTLNLARIPFTVFAFLGGALAIGVGFGTQTIIKNFVSGLVVLMERRVQVGDIVEVDNITGTVTEVSLRASTVRGFDGVEAIVPNSTLLENRVTNWTHTDRKVRRVVKVGVAYGSPVREVSDILLECGKRHGLILADPAPMVIFEDFGDSALVFALYFWVELGPAVNSLQVMSDLRFMIEKRFAEAGIVVAYPQRDVRLAAAAPLRVEVVPGSAIPSAVGAK